MQQISLLIHPPYTLQGVVIQPEAGKDGEDEVGLSAGVFVPGHAGLVNEVEL